MGLGKVYLTRILITEFEILIIHLAQRKKKFKQKKIPIYSNENEKKI